MKTTSQQTTTNESAKRFHRAPSLLQLTLDGDSLGDRASDERPKLEHRVHYPREPSDVLPARARETALHLCAALWVFAVSGWGVRDE
jgi:hypothetical protein